VLGLSSIGQECTNLVFIVINEQRILGKVKLVSLGKLPDYIKERRETVKAGRFIRFSRCHLFVKLEDKK